MTMKKLGRTWALAAALILPLTACGGPSLDEQCKNDARRIALSALDSGIPSMENPRSCAKLERWTPGRLAEIGAELRDELRPLMFDPNGDPTPQYAAILRALAQPRWNI